MTHFNSLPNALNRYAHAYENTGADWDEAMDAAEIMLKKLRKEFPNLTDYELAQSLDIAAEEYRDI